MRWTTDEEQILLKFVRTGLPMSDFRWEELVTTLNAHRTSMGLPERTVRLIVCKMARIDKSVNGSELIPGAIDTEIASNAVQSSHDGARSELASLRDEKRLEEAQERIRVKKKTLCRKPGTNSSRKNAGRYRISLPAI